MFHRKFKVVITDADFPSHEPLPPDSPLRRLNNLIMTPHMAWYSEESLRELREKAAMEVKRVLTGERPKNIVNPTVLKLGRSVNNL